MAVRDAVQTGRISRIILPIGSLEQHGPHLPVSTDTMIADYVARKVSERCLNAFLLPAIQLGCSGEHLGFPGTLSLRPETMSSMIADICASTLESGIRKTFIINGHGGNRATLDVVITELKQMLPAMQLYSFTILDIVKEKFAGLRKSGRRLVGHADEIETSMMLAIRPQSVDMSKAVREELSLPQTLSFESDDLARISFGWSAKELTKTGVIGDATIASAETGSTLLSFAVDTISKAINEL
jgi:creatinine amidohydrolase